MKKILIIDSKSHLPYVTLPAVSCLRRKLGTLDTAEDDPDGLAAAFVHKDDLASRKYVNSCRPPVTIIVGNDTPAFESVREKINLPRARYEARIADILRQYQSSGSLDRSLLSMDDSEFSSWQQAQAAPGAPRLLLRSLRVAGVKSARDSGDMELPRLAVLVGRNGSGKSAVLEALQWLQDALRDGLSAATSRRYKSFRDLCTHGSNQLQFNLKLASADESQHLSYDLVVTGSDRGVPEVARETCHWGGTEEINTDEHGIRWIGGGIQVDQPDRLALPQAGPASGAQRLVTLLRQAVFLRLYPRALAQPSALQRPAGGPCLDEEGADLPALLSELEATQSEGRGRLLRYLQETLVAGIKKVDLERHRDQGVLVVDQSVGEGQESIRLPAWVLSEGTRRLTALYAVMSFQPPPSLLVIEEIENGLDPWTLRSVLRALRSTSEDGVSVLLTTHSPYLLDAFEPRNIIHVIYRDGQSHYRLASSYEDVMKYEGEIPPGVLYTEGYFRSKS